MSAFSPSVARYRLVSVTQKINSVSNDGTVGAGCVGVDGLLSELDEYAVEQALQIKENQWPQKGTKSHKNKQKRGARTNRCL